MREGPIHQSASLETTLQGRSLSWLTEVYPGLLSATMIALAATWLSQHYQAPVMLFALLLGTSSHFLYDEFRCRAGIEFSSRTILRIGVALLGARITVDQITSLGILPIAMIFVGVFTTILVGVIAARALGLRRTFGLLSGGAVGICGASAALAIASVLPQDPDKERDTILTVVVVTTLSTIAMVLYPMIAARLVLNHIDAGIFLGSTIHDVAQVVGAGYTISPETGEIATYVKLLRVALLIPVVFMIATMTGRSDRKVGSPRAPALPRFLVGFVALVIINSMGLLPPAAMNAAGEISRWCLVTAIAALGIKTSFKSLYAVGWRPIALMVLETIWIAALAIAALCFF